MDILKCFRLNLVPFGSDPIKKSVVFVGGGNMATSLIGGLVANGYSSQRITVVDLNQKCLDALQHKFSVSTSINIDGCVDSADAIVLAVKPQNLRQACSSLAACLGSRSPLIISIVAGIRSVDIDRWLGGKKPIVRAMPNTPALLQVGASGLFANKVVDEDQRQHAHAILSATGIALWVDTEKDIDAVTALSGSGPAYFFRIMEGLINGAGNLGLSHETARLLTLQTALGAAKMALESDEDVGQLRERVTSPGGTTEQGLRVLNDYNIDEILQSVLDAASKRVVELADQFGADHLEEK